MRIHIFGIHEIYGIVEQVIIIIRNAGNMTCVKYLFNSMKLQLFFTNIILIINRMMFITIET